VQGSPIRLIRIWIYQMELFGEVADADFQDFHFDLTATRSDTHTK
jgi:hypothetical protein